MCAVVCLFICVTLEEWLLCGVICLFDGDGKCGCCMECLVCVAMGKVVCRFICFVMGEVIAGEVYLIVWRWERISKVSVNAIDDVVNLFRY